MATLTKNVVNLLKLAKIHKNEEHSKKKAAEFMIPILFVFFDNKGLEFGKMERCSVKFRNFFLEI